MARKPKKPADMSFILQSSQGTLAQIAKKTNYLTRLDDLVQTCCPDLPSDVWHIANIRQKTVVIEVKSSVWSQRLQFERVNIAHSIAEFTENACDKIEIKVSPYFNKAKPMATSNVESVPTPRSIPEETAVQLREIALKAPTSLQKKLEKLALLARHKKS